MLHVNVKPDHRALTNVSKLYNSSDINVAEEQDCFRLRLVSMYWTERVTTVTCEQSFIYYFHKFCAAEVQT
jgi:hypothetical protein